MKKAWRGTWSPPLRRGAPLGRCPVELGIIQPELPGRRAGRYDIQNRHRFASSQQRIVHGGLQRPIVVWNSSKCGVWKSYRRKECAADRERGVVTMCIAPTAKLRGARCRVPALSPGGLRNLMWPTMTGCPWSISARNVAVFLIAGR